MSCRSQQHIVLKCFYVTEAWLCMQPLQIQNSKRSWSHTQDVAYSSSPKTFYPNTSALFYAPIQPWPLYQETKQQGKEFRHMDTFSKRKRQHLSPVSICACQPASKLLPFICDRHKNTRMIGGFLCAFREEFHHTHSTLVDQYILWKCGLVVLFFNKSRGEAKQACDQSSCQDLSLWLSSNILVEALICHSRLCHGPVDKLGGKGHISCL